MKAQANFWKYTTCASSYQCTVEETLFRNAAQCAKVSYIYTQTILCCIARHYKMWYFRVWFRTSKCNILIFKIIEHAGTLVSPARRLTNMCAHFSHTICNHWLVLARRACLRFESRQIAVRWRVVFMSTAERKLACKSQRVTSHAFGVCAGMRRRLPAHCFPSCHAIQRAYYCAPTPECTHSPHPKTHNNPTLLLMLLCEWKIGKCYNTTTIPTLCVCADVASTMLPLRCVIAVAFEIEWGRLSFCNLAT